MLVEYETPRIPPQRYREICGYLRPLFCGSIAEIAKIVPSYRIKNWLYRRIGVDIGKETVIAPHVQMDPFFPERISIGDNCMIGWGAKLFTHTFTTDTVRTGDIVIGDNVLIGIDTVIRPGIEIGDNAVIGAKSFVNKDVPPGARVGGVPAKDLDRDSTD